MKEKSYAGSFTVYFSMMLLSALALFLGILWVSGYWIGKNDALRITQAAGGSVLSCYNAELADQYGLYGTDASQLEQRMTDFSKMNEELPKADIYSRPSYLLAPRKLWEGIFSYQVKNVTVTNVKTLSDEQVFQNQINQFMKYRFLQDTLLEYLEMLQEAARGSGMQAQYARIQNILMEYNSAYTELVKCLYPEGRSDIYVTITEEEEYAPGRLYDAVISLRNSELEMSADWEVLALWQDDGGALYEQNQRASEHTAQLQEYIADLKEELSEWQELVAELSSEKKAEVQTMIDGVEKIKNEVWGLHGEAGELQKILIRNQRVTKGLEDITHDLLSLNSTGEEISKERWQELENVAAAFLQYDGNISLEYTKTSGRNKWNLDGIWKWIQKFQVDLKKYGEDEALLDEVVSVTETSLVAAVQAIEEESENIVSSVTDKIALVEYTMGMFKNLSDQLKEENGEQTYNLRGEAFWDTFFKNEGEFVLQGSFNEYKNLQGVQFKILGVRLIMNMMHLMGSPEKQALIQQVAESTGGIVAPGVGAGIAYGAVLFLWSAAESYVDYSILVQNGKVPLLKDNESWHTDLESILEKAYRAEEVQKQEGLDYEMHLKLLVVLTDREMLLERLQALIQLNMQKNGMEGFMLSDMATAFDVTTEIQGKTGLYLSGEGFQYE